MKYVVGLGNPGERYAATRHNLGWLVLDYWLEKTNLPTASKSTACAGLISQGVVNDTAVTALYPQTQMNNSGTAVAKLNAPPAALTVIYDDVDLPFGQLKISVGGGTGGHNGARSVTTALKTPDYARLRVGIAPRGFWGSYRRPPADRLSAFVLRPFTAKERLKLPDVVARASEALTTIVTKGPTVAMNRFN